MLIQEEGILFNGLDLPSHFAFGLAPMNERGAKADAMADSFAFGQAPLPSP